MVDITQKLQIIGAAIIFEKKISYFHLKLLSKGLIRTITGCQNYVPVVIEYFLWPSQDYLNFRLLWTIRRASSLLVAVYIKYFVAHS